MFALIFFAVFVLLANEGKALNAEGICCEEIESLLKNKTTAYQTVCLGRASRLSRNCCRNIKIEIEKHRHAYKTLCPTVAKPATTPTTPPSTTTATTTATTTETTTATTIATTTAVTSSPSTGMFVFNVFPLLFKQIHAPFASH
jgi:hypothetical protein